MKNIAIWADNVSVNFCGEKDECAEVAQVLETLGVVFVISKLPQTLAEPAWFGKAWVETAIDAQHLVELLRLP